MTVRERRLHEERLQVALTYAQRSMIKGYHTGAVIFDAQGEVSSGWSHYSEQLALKQLRSVHAELHAVLRADRRRLNGSVVYVATIRRKSRTTGLARPCDTCASVLCDVGITEAVYTVEGDEWGHMVIEERRVA